MGIEEGRKKKIEELGGEITQGWILYGEYMNKGDGQNPIAVELLSVIRRLEKSKAEILTTDDESALQFIKKHGGDNDSRK